MLTELHRLLHNAPNSSTTVHKRDLMLVSKIVQDPDGIKGSEALMLQLVAVQEVPEHEIHETHHSIVVLSPSKVAAWARSGMETIEVSKLFETMVIELERKYEAHLEATINAKLDPLGIKAPE